MPWTPLAGRLNDLPLMLAGPILREVTPEFVTVWVALRKHAEVELVVIDPVGDKPLSGKRPTVAIGTNLHIVAVTAKRQPPFAPLKEGIVYRYEMTFAFDGGPPQSLTVVAPTPRLPIHRSRHRASVSLLPTSTACASFTAPAAFRTAIRSMRCRCWTS